jgi:hypothetical protein
VQLRPAESTADLPVGARWCIHAFRNSCSQPSRISALEVQCNNGFLATVSQWRDYSHSEKCTLCVGDVESTVLCLSLRRRESSRPARLEENTR